MLDPKFSELYYDRGSAYFGTDDYDRAIADFEQALKLNSSLPEAQQELEHAQVLLAKRSNPGTQTKVSTR